MTPFVSTPEREGVYQGSKWLKFQVLCDGDELESLFNRLFPFSLFPLTGVVDGKAIPIEAFLSEYRSWIEGLKEGRIPEERALRKILAAALVEDVGALWLQEVAGKGYLVKIGKPVVQAQAHWFSYSKADSVFRPMSMGSNSIFWGIQFSYPQIYQDPKTMELKEAEAGRVFELLRLWVREFTRATPFVVEEKRINASIRLGKQCFSWIGRHPQLAEQGISIYGC